MGTHRTTSINRIIMIFYFKINERGHIIASNYDSSKVAHIAHFSFEGELVRTAAQRRAVDCSPLMQCLMEMDGYITMRPRFLFTYSSR